MLKLLRTLSQELHISKMVMTELGQCIWIARMITSYLHNGKNRR